MYNSDYIILFDENDQPYIAHANISAIKEKVNTTISNIKTRAKGYQRENHKYYMRIDDPKRSGKYLYFYSKQEYDRYLKADIVRQQAEKAYKANPSRTNLLRLTIARKQSEQYGSRDNPTTHSIKNASRNIKSKYEQMRTSIRNKAGIGTKAKYEKEKKEADDFNDKYERTFQAFRKAIADNNTKEAERLQQILKRYEQDRVRENQEARTAKEIHDKSIAGRIENMRSEFHDRRVQREQEKAIAEAESKRAKEEAATAQQYEFRKNANFNNGIKAIWNSNKKYSEYSDESLAKSVQKALKQDGVVPYSGNDEQILRAQATMKARRKTYEEHAIDLKMAQKELIDLQDKARRANEALEAIKNDPTSSKEALITAKRLNREAMKAFMQAQNDVIYLESQLRKDESSYKSAIQVYNTYLHIGDKK